MNNKNASPITDLQRLQLLLRMEYEYEKEEFRRQTETMGIARKVKRGVCWHPVTPGKSFYNSLNQLVIEIKRTEEKETEHAFEFGRLVCFFRQGYDGKIQYMNFTATVSYADNERMVVALPSAGALLEIQNEGGLGVQLFFDETSYRTMFEALEEVLRAKGNRLADLRDTLLGSMVVKHRELYPVRFPWLNSTQEEAVNKVLCAKDVAIVHGPPGTGKTTTLVEAIYETLHCETQVMVCAQSNTAVDWISEKLVDRVIFAGDHCQLPPTIKCIEAARGGLSHTLMEKIVATKPTCVSLLKIQYRMHETIMRFPSEWFYQGELQAATEIRYRGILDYDTPMTWIDTSEMEFREEFVGESFGRINKSEGDLLLLELKAYIKRIGEARVLDERIDFGLISPYKAQVHTFGRYV